MGHIASNHFEMSVRRRVVEPLNDFPYKSVMDTGKNGRSSIVVVE